MGRKGTVDIEAAGWDPREATLREQLALERMHTDNPGVQDFIAIENLCDRCHGQGCLLDFDDKGERDESACPGYCLTRDDAWRKWGSYASGQHRPRPAERLPLLQPRRRRMVCGSSRRPRQVAAVLSKAPRARSWQDQAEPSAAAAARRDEAFAKIAAALAGDDRNHRELRRACLMLQAFCAWADADFADEEKRRKALGDWISQAQGCGVHEIATAAGSIKGVKERVLSAYATGKTNAYAENADRKIKDMKRRACGLANCESMRRRLLLAYGYPPVGKGGVPLPSCSE